MVRSPLSFLFPVIILLLSLGPSQGQGYKPDEAAGKMVVPEGLTVKLFASEALPPTAYPLANAQDHRPMPLHQDFKGRLIALAGEALQHLSIAEAAITPAAHDAAQLTQNGG